MDQEGNELILPKAEQIFQRIVFRKGDTAESYFVHRVIWIIVIQKLF